MDQAAELAELRRLAYSRSGTEDDRRRLAQLESSIHAVTASPSPAPVWSTEIVEEGDDGAPREAAEVEEAPVSRSRWLPALLGAAGGALLATAATLTLVAVGTPEPGPQTETTEASSLIVFDRAPRGIDDPATLWVDLEYLVAAPDGSPADPDDLTLRWVGMAAGNDVYAVRWDQEDEESTICLIVVAADHAGSGCSTESEFAAAGLRIGTTGVEVKWGPTGTEVWVNSFG